MPRATAPLTDTQVKNAKARDKQYTMFDGGGLFLLVVPTGGKLWRLKFRLAGKEKVMALGAYPEVSLADARQRREDARKLIAAGKDPVAEKKAPAGQGSSKKFQEVALEWFALKKPDWSEKHATRLMRRMEIDLFPELGDRPLAEIKTPELARLLERVAVRTLETAHRLKIACDHIYRYAVIHGLCENNPAASLRGLLPAIKYTHMAAPTEPQKVAGLVRAIDAYRASYVVERALRLAPLFFIRPGVLRSAEWVEFSFEKSEWNIPKEKMKMGRAHLVPLSRQAIEILNELQVVTGGGKYLFPSIKSPARCMSDGTINKALRRLGFGPDEITGHGFRAMARTLLHEVLHFSPDAIEAQLAHRVPDRLGEAYNRTLHLEERKKMMQAWADYLDDLKAGKGTV